MKAIVTGGAGFIGSHLVDRLVNDGHDVVVVDNLSNGKKSNLELSIARIKFYNSCIYSDDDWKPELENADWVIHLAALADIVPSIESPKDYYYSNVNGTFEVINSCNLKVLKKFVYAASASCYGISNSIPTSETSAKSPEYPYALTKLMGEDLAFHWNKVYKLPLISLRFFNVFGERSRTSGTYGAVFGTFLAQKLNNQPFTVVGDGNQTRDFTYVSDVVEGIISSLNSKADGEAINIGSGNPQSVNRLVELLKGNVVNIPKRPGEPDITCADISKAKKLLGWQPKVSFEKGVEKLLENIHYWDDAPVWNEKTIKKATKSWFEHLDEK
jgi:UDP-glucose 4-epimerase